MRKSLLFLSAFLLLMFQTLAQERTVTGTVTDESGEGIPGVNVIIEGTSTGVVTDISGNYSISVSSSDAVLVFSSVGYATQRVVVGAQNTIDIVMEEDVQQLTEVVVTAFGIEKEKKALAYSVQDVSGEKLENAGTPNTVNAMQGKVAGVQVNQSSGMPGSSSFIRIRGSNSFTGNNQPLFVVDGVPIASNASSSGAVSGTDYSSRALDLNPSDIESISVLKGPTAAALYGSRASNGVVVITTKSGKNLKAGQFKVNLRQSFQVDEVSLTPDLQSTYGQGSGGIYSPTASTSWGPRISNFADPSVNAFADGNGQYVNNVGELVTPRVYDNVSPMFDNGTTSITNLEILGASEKFNYAVSGAYTTQDGIIPTTGMDKINFKLAGDYKLNDKFSSGARINVVVTDIDKLAGGSNLSNVLFTTYWAPRSYDLWGTPFATEADPYQQIHYRGAMDNPRWSLANNSFNEKITRTFGNVYFKYKPLDWITVNYKFGADVFSEQRKEVYALGSGFTGGRTVPPSGGQITELTYNYQQINSNLNMVISKALSDDFYLDFLLGNELIDIRTKSLGVTGNGIVIGGFDQISNTSAQTTTVGTSQQRTVGFFANASLSWRDMLFLNASGRMDYVSNMPEANRSFFYPSIGLGFVFTEPWDGRPEWFNFGKIRGSYAEVGQPGPIQATQVPFLSAGTGTGFTNDGIAFPTFNNLIAYQQSNALRDPNLEPQNVTTWEVGVQLELFNRRLGIDATYFNENSTDQIFTVPLAPSSGYTSILRNAGELENQGWEVVLNLVPLQTQDWEWNITANYTRLRSEVISLAPGVENIFLGGFVTPNVRAYAGSPYPVVFGSRFLRDDEGRVVVDNREFVNGVPNSSYGMPVQNPDDGVIGQVNPDYEVGLSSSLSYKNLTLSVHFDIRVGGQAYAGNTRLQKLYGMDEVTEDRESPYVVEGVKGYYSFDSDGNVVVESEGENDIVIERNQQYWQIAMDAIDESNVYDTDFVRFRELNLTYNFPQSILGGGLIKNLGVFFQARNLALWTKYPNFDPETSVGGASNFQGLEYVNLPQTRSIGGGINVTF
ncbi:SusC/RagA family TonB-linked outer membrane protein [Mangrovivirga sp. M17]|uniref:SusC/RagA family TonB-linked outer membrane protein n=1 Tax=Mangrovivirga halotolerans TaxID=2993936 RepID=A0ABT3RT37_9BACT|nr:SusC/RagA family TonB-linked outer membrane protein [Mangrovivirga halotolerans]MCX2744949.1 SusC/RagA family TonB-linked outer membrane protein [Mangrovivirga halotolerans]